MIPPLNRLTTLITSLRDDFLRLRLPLCCFHFVFAIFLFFSLLSNHFFPAITETTRPSDDIITSKILLFFCLFFIVIC